MSVLWLQRLDLNQRPQCYEPCELPTALSCQRGLPELRTPAGEIKNECVEQKKGDNKWKAVGGGKGSEDVEHSRKSLPFPPAFMLLSYHKYFCISLYFTVIFSGTEIFFNPAE